MIFKISVKKSSLIFSNTPLIFSVLMFFYFFMSSNNLNLVVQMLIIFLPFLLLFSYFAFTFTFFRSVQFEKENLLIFFGPFIIHKKYYYRDMKDIRYAKKGDYILRGQPAYGITEKTVAITFKDETMYFISVEQTSEFYELLLNKITEANSEFSET